MAVSINRKREAPQAEVVLTTPYGATITVPADRADNFLARPPIAFGDGKFRKYVLDGEDTLVPVAVTKAVAPRTGARTNTEGGAE